MQPNNIYRSMVLVAPLVSLLFISNCSRPSPSTGCTCQFSSNFDAFAEEDDGSCLGCTNLDAMNYNYCASIDDGSCFINGCTDPNALNYDPDANRDDGSCEPAVYGCTNVNAINYDPHANRDDGSCVVGEYLILRNLNPNGGRPTLLPDKRRVTLLFQVLKRDGSSKNDLKTAKDDNDFQLRESSGTTRSSLAPISSTEADATWGTQHVTFEVFTVLVIDISNSIEGHVPVIKSAVTSFIDSKSENQQIAIYTFDTSPKQIIGFSSNSQKLKDALKQIPETGLSGTTNLWGAINDISDEDNKNELPDWKTEISPNKKIRYGNMIIFTDGSHNAGSSGGLNVHTARQKFIVTDNYGNEIQYVYEMFVVGIQTEDFKVGEENIRSLLYTTAGELEHNFFVAKDFDELTTRFREVQNRIGSLANSVYLLDYKSPKITRETTYIEITVKDNVNTAEGSSIVTYFTSFGPE